MTTPPTTADLAPPATDAETITRRAPDEVPSPLVLLAADDAFACLDDACLPPEAIE